MTAIRTHRFNGKAWTRPTAELLDREPPHDSEAEKRVLGSLLLDGAKLPGVASIITPQDFHAGAHRKLFEHLVAMRADGVPIDTETVIARLEAAGDYERIGKSDYLEQILRSVAVSAHAIYYAKIVRDHAARRRIIADALDVVQGAYSNEPLSDLVRRGRNAFEHAADQAEPLFKGVTAPQLDTANYSVKFLIDGHLVEGQPCFIGGAMKTCKSLFALDAAISLASGQKFLGQFDVPEVRRTAAFSGEGGLSVLQEYARRIARSKGFELGDIGALVFCDRLPQLTNSEHRDGFGRFLLDNEIAVAFLDPCYLMMDGQDAGNLMKQGAILASLNRVCVQAGVTAVLIHHCRKNTVAPFAPPELSDLAWAGFAEFAGQWWLLGRREKYSGDTPGEHKLWMNVGGRAGHSALHALDIHEGRRDEPGGRYWKVEIRKAKEARDEAHTRHQESAEEDRDQAIRRDVDRIVRAAAKFAAGETKRELANHAGLSGGRFNLALARLLDNGDMVPCQIHKPCRKTPYEGYKLVK